MEVVESGEYRISLRRFPRESGLGFNAQFLAAERPPKLQQSMPASNNVGFVSASLSIADFSKKAPIEEQAEEVSFDMHLLEGKFDMVAQLYDLEGKCYPSYFVYMEKKDN